MTEKQQLPSTWTFKVPQRTLRSLLLKYNRIWWHIMTCLQLFSTLDWLRTSHSWLRTWPGTCLSCDLSAKTWDLWLTKQVSVCHDIEFSKLEEKENFGTKEKCLKVILSSHVVLIQSHLLLIWLKDAASWTHSDCSHAGSHLLN